MCVLHAQIMSPSALNITVTVCRIIALGFENNLHYNVVLRADIIIRYSFSIYLTLRLRLKGNLCPRFELESVKPAYTKIYGLIQFYHRYVLRFSCRADWHFLRS